jgi:hypothetical protein
MRDGRIMTGKFKDHKSGKVLLEDGAVLDIKDVKMMTIRKLETSIGAEEGKRIKFRANKQ